MIDTKLLTYLEEFISPERKKRFLEVLEHRTKMITVAMEDVYQKHNASAVVRSCEIFGVQEAHIIERKYGNRLDKAIAMGSENWVDVYSYRNTADCIHNLRNQGYKIIATSPHENNCLLQDFKVDGKTALFFGTERNGLSEEVKVKADGFLKIPMVGFTESLNISVSAAIILQALTTQIRKQESNWQLSENEQLEKRLDWTKKSVRSINHVLQRYNQLA